MDTISFSIFYSKIKIIVKQTGEMMKYKFILALPVFLLILVLLSACEQNACNRNLTCPDGSQYPAESINKKTGECEGLMYAGGTPCFDESKDTPQ